MLERAELPPEARLVRTTREFSAGDVPAGLLSAHRMAEGVWGRLCVRAGSVVFVLEDPERSRSLEGGDVQVIEPGVPHRVEPSAGARFVVEFYR